jgi:predicted transcriptional regulator
MKKSANDWLKELMEAAGPCGKPDEVPEGWLTLKEMQEAVKLPTSTMNGRIQKLLRQGLLQKKKFRIRSNHQVTGVWHYTKKILD